MRARIITDNQNCAVVDITNGGSGLNPTDYPAPFVANAGVNQCSTIENVDPVFPNPGKNVKYGGAYAGTTPESGKGITGTGCDAPGGANGPGSSGGNGGGSGGSQTSAPAASSSTSSGSGQGAGVSVSIGIDGHVLAPVGTAAPTSTESPTASPTFTDVSGTVASAAPSASGSSSGQRVCRRRRSSSKRSTNVNINRTKRSPAPEARVLRSRLFAHAAGHAARKYNPHARLAERF